MIDGKNFFNQPVKCDMKIYNNIRKIATGQVDDYTTGSLLGYIYFKYYNRMIGKYLRKQQELDVDPKPIYQINVTGNLEEQSTIFFVIGEAKKDCFRFFTRNCKCILILFFL